MGNYRFNSWLLNTLRHQREGLDSRHRVLSDGANRPVPPAPDWIIRGAGIACFLLAGLSVCDPTARLCSPACGAAGTANSLGHVAPKMSPQTDRLAEHL